MNTFSPAQAKFPVYPFSETDKAALVLVAVKLLDAINDGIIGTVHTLPRQAMREADRLINASYSLQDAIYGGENLTIALAEMEGLND